MSRLLVVLLLVASPALAASEFEADVARAEAAAVARALSTELVRWDAVGGEAPYAVQSWLTRAGEYHHAETPRPWYRDGKPNACVVPSSPVFSEVRQSLSHPDVAAAFAKRNVSFGWDTRCHDGSMLRIQAEGATILVGDACPADGSPMSCQSVCTDAPKGVQALADLLGSLDRRMARTAPACKAARQP